MSAQKWNCYVMRVNDVDWYQHAFKKASGYGQWLEDIELAVKARSP
jgi:hypothetical protein